MPDPAEEQSDILERYRDYLRVLVEIQVSASLRNKLDLSGVVQQTMFDAHTALQEDKPVDRANLLPWLRCLLANNLTDAIRWLQAGKRAVHREISLEQQLEQSSIRMAAFLAADQSAPVDQLIQQERAVRLTTALCRLPPAQREAIILQHWHGYSLQQIAEQLNRTTMAVAGLLKRGLRSLRVEFQDSQDSS